MQLFQFDVQTALAAFLPKLGLAILIFIVSLYLSGLVSKLVRKAMERRQPAHGAGKLLEDLTRWGILVFGTITALQQFADVTAFLAGLGILGFTVGFALQDVMKNFAAGVLLLLQQPFRVGDSISVQGFDGAVLAIDLRSTELVTVDGRTVILPNADVLNHAIVNYTRSVRRRIDLPVSVAYGSDLNLVRETILAAVAGVPGVLPDPAPVAMFQLFSATAIDLILFFWVDTSQAGIPDARNAAIQGIKQALEAQGIEIPYPAQKMVFEEKVKLVKKK